MTTLVFAFFSAVGQEEDEVYSGLRYNEGVELRLRIA